MSQRPTPEARLLERKIRRARFAAIFEQLWLRVWIVAAVAAVFLLASLAGLWSVLPNTLHVIVLGLFGIALLAGLVQAGPLKWLSRDEAIRRIEGVSGLPHRPASSYEDTLSSENGPVAASTSTLWQAHRARMAAMLRRLRVGPPRPRTHRFDPFALRALLVIGVAALGGLTWSSAPERLRSAFTFGAEIPDTARLDAWVSPPTYTGRPPIMLADGAKLAARSSDEETGKPIKVPVNSTLIARLSGADDAELTLNVVYDGTENTEQVEPNDTGKAVASDAAELRFDVKANAQVMVMSGGTELAAWTLSVTPDQLPVITMSKTPEATRRGSMKLTYKITDDYGVASAEAKLKRVMPKTADPDKAWAKLDPLQGPRWPKERPPKLTLKVPPSAAKDGETSTYLEVGPHPFAGKRVQLTLEATDVAGQVGRSPTIEIVLPERRFTKPLARAVVEQRGKLMDDHRYRDQVITALDAFTMEPEGFIDDIRVYLGLRTASYRLQGDRSREGMKSVIDQLWDVALKIEDGDLSEAEKRLREAQDKLAKLLEEGASDEEIQAAMKELREAMNDFMQQLAKEQGDSPRFDGQNQDMQTMSQQDMQRMMDNLEQMARNGSREEAQQMLSEMRDLMERMQQGRMSAEQQQRNEEMLKLMDELGGVVGDQQKLMDETFKERREQGQRNRGGNNEQQSDQQRFGAANNSGPQQQAERGDRPGQRPGQMGQGQQQQGQGQQGGQRRPGDGKGAGSQGQGGMEGLRQRQRELRERLAQLQRDINEKGGQPSEQLEGARESMEAAERALNRGDLPEATQQQGRALDQLRQGAQQMAQEMLRNMPQRMGQNGDTPRDPLGRPQRSQGPDLGTAVKVPDQIDMQRAREILEELRRRLGDVQRPEVELDYLERLLKRF